MDEDREITEVSVDCGHCGGEGAETCGGCEGSGWDKHGAVCCLCESAGKISCPDCDGEGFWWETI